MKTNVILASIIIVLALGLFGLYDLYRGEKTDRKRYFSDMQAMVKKIQYNSDSSLACMRVISLKKSEVEELYPEIIDELKSVNLNVKNVMLYQSSTFGVNAKFMSHLIDSISGSDTMRLAKFSDKYIEFLMAWTQKDSIAPTNFSMDIDLQSALYKKRKDGFWGWFKPRVKQIEIWTDNPYAKLKYNQTIEFTK